jgi:hypothetical protein
MLQKIGQYAKVEIFLLRELGDRLWEVLVKPARKGKNWE